MGNLLVSLRNAAGAMSVFERGMSVVQSNVTNASTPGYARQRQDFEATRFDLDIGVVGGVASGGTVDSRSQYAEASVRRRLEFLGEADERNSQLERLEPVFDIKNGSGVAGAMDRLFQAFSALAVTPNDTSARQVALDRAGEVARGFNGASASLTDASANVDRALAGQVARINDIATRIVEVNKQFQHDFRAQNDAGLQARLHNLLDELSETGDYTVLRKSDGSASVYFGGQAPLVMGDRSMPFQTDTSGAAARILDSQGNDVTGQVSRGRLHALVELRNETIPGYQGQLDKLAQSLADTVNTTLAGGLDMSDQPPAQGLFGYDAALGAARTLTVNPLAPSELALADPASPGNNGVALRLAGLAQAKSMDGFTFAQFYGNLAAVAGRQVTSSREALQTHQQLTAQARQLRDDAQKVSLDEEAILLMEYQRAYQAAGRMVQTLSDMTETVINLIR